MSATVRSHVAMTPPTSEIDGSMLRDAQATTEDCQLVEALRRGEEVAFVSLLNQYHVPMRRLAMVYVSDASVAEEVVQETWMAVVTGVGRFEARSSLKT